jgi:mannose-6-phosphate isomerase-like protein (cupin superfamily)
MGRRDRARHARERDVSHGAPHWRASAADGDAAGPGEDIGREAHPHLDQFLRIESGSGRVEFGRTEDAVEETHDVADDWAIIVPAGVWHNVVNTGEGDLKLYSIYAPPEHPDGTVHRTKADAEAAEHP